MNLGNILVATDFSEAAHRAEQRAAKLAQQLDSRLQLIHVLPDAGLLQRLFGRDSVDHAQMRRCAEQALGSSCAALERTHDIDVDWEVVTGSAARSIGVAIDRYAADLLVVGTRGEHAPAYDKTTLGGTALKLLAQSSIPLLLVRRAVEEPYGSILLAVSAEEAARRMFSVVEPICGSAKCHLVHAAEAPFAERLKKLDVSRSAIDTYSQEQFSAGQQLIDRLVEKSIIKDRCRPVVVRGNPGSTLLREIGRLEPELVVIGKHGRHPENPEAAGGIGPRIAQRAHADILQVP